MHISEVSCKAAKVPYQEQAWNLAHNPTSFDDLVLSRRDYNLLSRLERRGGGMSLLLYGPNGCGKTVAASLINPRHVIFRLPLDEETLVEQIRDQFAIMSEESDRIAIVIDGGDMMARKTQDELCNLIDESKDFADFFVTADRESSLSHALGSRLLPIGLADMPDYEVFDDCANLLRRVISRAGVTDVPDEYLESLAEMHYPDFRTMLHHLQLDLTSVR